MKYSLACCFLTHNHFDTMKEILDKCLTTYAEHQIDIYICDDSDDDSTKNQVDNYIHNGATNLYYIDNHNATTGDHKLLLLLQEQTLPRQYDYIWVCKDRMCFSSSYLDRLVYDVDAGHDVIISTCELSRWDVGINVYHDIYTDPAELYRLYAVSVTNLGALIIKSSFLTPIDWDNNNYGASPTNNFNQLVVLFNRLLELERFSVKICRYDLDERFISSKSGSMWGNIMFELWIERWVTTNYSLPKVYDKYKAEAIKSETNLSELFGSVERMVILHKQGVFTSEVFNRYLSIWPFVTNIPVEILKMITEGMYDEVIQNTAVSFELSFVNHDFSKAWWIFASNTWFNQIYDDKEFRILIGCFNKYRSDMMHFGQSDIFEGINSVQDLIDRYYDQV